MLREVRHVAGERGRVARDVDDARGPPGRHGLDDGTPGADAGRVEHDDVRPAPVLREHLLDRPVPQLDPVEPVRVAPGVAHGALVALDGEDRAVVAHGCGER